MQGSKTLNRSLNQTTGNAKGATATGGALNTTLGNASTRAQPIERNKKQEISSEELVMQQPISAVEDASLRKVFTLLCNANGANANTTINNNSQNDLSHADAHNASRVEGSEISGSRTYFTSKEVGRVLTDLGYHATKAEIDQMIWEVNDSLNGRINEYEFWLMYKRCSLDQTGLEPRNLYNVVQFLMFLQNNQEAGKEKKKITVEDTLELLYVRHGRNKLDNEIEEIFGKEQKNADGQEKELSLEEFLQKIKKKDFRDRERLQKERNTVKIPGKEEDEYA